MLSEGPYNFTENEKNILALWLKNRVYKPEYDPKTKSCLSTNVMKRDSREPFCIICPPPNSYARPHLGNISGYAYQDAMGRIARMQGKKVLLLPGKDHAGLEGEGVFIREVLEKQKRNKFDLTREEFFKEIWNFNQANKLLALKDEKDIGLSADYDRDIFTLDKRIVKIVLNTFLEMYKKGMIYRGVRTINWDPKARSVVSDNQCVREERVSILYYIRYIRVQTKSVVLNFNNNHDWDKLKKGEKVVDLRVVNRTEKERYFGSLKKGDILVCKNSETGEYVYKKVGGVFEYKKLEDCLEKIEWRSVTNDQIISIEDLKKYVSNLFPRYLDEVQKNGFFSISFKDLDEEDYLEVATTRIETMFGDVALAVNPKDSINKKYVGERAIIPLTEIEIPVIASERVLQDYGTGILKITPSHSQDDFVIAEEYNRENGEKLGYRNVIGKDLKLTGKATGRFEGFKYKEALPKIIEELKQKSLYAREEKTKQNVLLSERTRAVIEPLMSSQWFVRVDEIKKPVIEMVRTGKVKIYPKYMESKFYYWMENLKDWAISRSLWWGYRMPIWYRGEIFEKVSEKGEIEVFIKTKEGKTFNLHLRDSSLVKVLPFNPDSTVIDFFRHAEAEHNLSGFVAGVTDTDLTEKGKKEALNLYQSFDFDYDIIITSPLKRAKQTAELISKKIKIPVIEDDLLIERNFGIFENHTWEEKMTKELQKVPHEELNISDLLPNAEPMSSVFERAKAFIEKVKNDYHGKKVLVVTHGVFIKAVIREFEGEEEFGKNIYDIDHLDYKRIEILPLKTEWLQEESVFDTWFSSGQWPFATLKSFGLFDTFFPTSVMETGFDILENWVSRMMMFSYIKFKTEPFKIVYLHGLVQGPDGQKMSKSRGNVISMDEARGKYGTDSLRMAYFYQNSAGDSYPLTFEKLKMFKNFNNKIWNASKFVLKNLPANYIFSDQALHEFSLKLQTHTNKLIEKINRNIKKFSIWTCNI